jgi:hypothetical protein
MTGDTSAHDIVHVGWRRHLALELVRERVQAAGRGTVPSVVVDDCVAQDPVEPCSGGLLVVDLPGFFNPSDERLLKDVLRNGSAPDAALDERQKRPVIGHEPLDDGLCSLYHAGRAHTRASRSR